MEMEMEAAPERHLQEVRCVSYMMYRRGTNI